MSKGIAGIRYHFHIKLGSQRRNVDHGTSGNSQTWARY